MKILLLKVPTFPYPRMRKPKDFSEKILVSSTPSLALATLKGFVQDNFKVEHEMIVHDLNICALNRGLEDIDAIGDAALAEAKAMIESFDFDVFAVSAQFMFNEPYCMDLRRYAKRKNPRAVLIEGGGYTTIFPNKAMTLAPLDYAVIGEGEHTFVHLLNKIAGVVDLEFSRAWPFDGYVERLGDGSLMQVNKTSFLPNLDLLSMPDWNYPSSIEYMRDAPNAYLTVMASRGCPMSCSFCSTHLSWGKSVRYRPIGKIIEELATNYQRFGIRKFQFVDDNISFNKQWFADMCSQIEANWANVPFELTFSNFDLRFLDEQILLALKKIRVKNVIVSTESGDPEIQQLIGKKLKLDKVKDTVKMIREHGFTIHNALLIGFPQESLQQMQNTINYARQLRTESIQILRVFPYPGTRIYTEGKALGVVDLDEDDFSSLNYQNGSINTLEWKTEQVRDLAYDASIELNFLNSVYYDSENGRNALRDKVKGLIDRLPPGHVILEIVAGYLDGHYYDNLGSRDQHYSRAYDYLTYPNCTFMRHMKWNFPQILDFKKWVVKQHSALSNEMSWIS